MGSKYSITGSWLGDLGVLASIVSVPLGIYFYFAQSRERILSFDRSHEPLVVVKAGEATEISVSYRDTPITSDVTATQVSVWNAGKESIKREHILKPVVIKTLNNCRILEAKIQKSVRSVSEVDLDTSQMAKGEIGLSWKILERNDGALIQLIYEGTPAIELRATSVIEGQGDVNVALKPAPIRKKPEDSRRDMAKVEMVAGIFFAVLTCVQLLGIFRFGWLNNGLTAANIQTLLQTILAATVSSWLLFNVYRSLKWLPPFQF